MQLVVWMNGQRVGIWDQTRLGRDTFRYDAAWVASPYARNLSLSLPITAGDSSLTGPEVGHYFDNLLPDHPRLRERVRQRYGLRSSAAVELLSAIGRDCVGAVQLLPPDTEPTGWDRIRSEPLTDAQVARHLRQVPLAGALAGSLAVTGADRFDDFRLSIAGAQEKTALLRIGDRWHRPIGATPTTHILKLPIGAAGLPFDVDHSVENEWLCAALLRELGLPVARTDIARFDDQKVLVVERFDRRWQGGEWIARLPQEDFCQATGTPAERKYEAHGGPGIAPILEILARSERPEQDRRTFVLAQLAFWVLAAIDGHAKNFSVRHGRDGFSLTPLYDVLSAWPFIGRGARRLPMQDVRLAMAQRGRRPHYLAREIQPRHFEQLARGLGDPGAWPAMCALVEGAPAALSAVERTLPAGFPGAVWEAIARGVTAQCRRFAGLM